MKIVLMNEESHDVVHIFSGDRRAIINVDGSYVFVDRVSLDRWEFSGEPARPGEELTMLNGLVRALGEGTTVTVTGPDE